MKAVKWVTGLGAESAGVLRLRRSGARAARASARALAGVAEPVPANGRRGRRLDTIEGRRNTETV